MPTYTAPLKKMSTQWAENLPVEYRLEVGGEMISLNALLGQKISFRYTGVIYCVQCGRKTKKSFQQGHCFPCYRRLLECNLCVIHPEKCRYDEGICKPDDWAHAHCGQPHMVYLANTSGLKVGITGARPFYTRWIDQGATQGLRIYTVQNRHQAGRVEVLCKKYLADKTHWQKMLKGENESIDMVQEREALFAHIQSEIGDILLKYAPEIQPLPHEEPTQISYPVLQYPTKITSYNLDKNPWVEGILQGIKGQYLLLDTGVISIRKFEGYELAWER
jgi:hypothetical protein